MSPVQSGHLHKNDKPEQMEYVIANIIADIIIMLLQDIPGKLKSGGIFLASGIIEERQNDVSAAASKVGLCVEAVDAKGGWVVMQMRKED